MTVSGRATLAGVVGDPVTHSLSPRLHGYWLSRHGVDGIYAPLPVARHEFARAVNALRAMGFAGVNVTIPHKEPAFALAHEADEIACAAGAANLLLFRDGRILARNTDVFGLAQNLRGALGDHALRDACVAIAGAGGAARAAILAARELGAADIVLLARATAKAETLAGSFAPENLRVIAWSEWETHAGAIDLFVNATSAGMKTNPPLELPLAPLPASATVCDLVYHPLVTPLLAAAAARGLRTVDGLGMLMHQAVPSFEAFFGVTPRVTPELRRELEDALAHG